MLNFKNYLFGTNLKVSISEDPKIIDLDKIKEVSMCVKSKNFDLDKIEKASTNSNLKFFNLAQISIISILVRT